MYRLARIRRRGCVYTGMHTPQSPHTRRCVKPATEHRSCKKYTGVRTLPSVELVCWCRVSVLVSRGWTLDFFPFAPWLHNISPSPEKLSLVEQRSATWRNLTEGRGCLQCSPLMLTHTVGTKSLRGDADTSRYRECVKISKNDDGAGRSKNVEAPFVGL
ncbi:hypothetical protein BDW02DRAFT_199428 [Decorospora gaudefroyi]|uniref:Uncharacterized protein n=1 Tax=Decorospora gaudefroyi TaxID=184978 RepID=A0A6A5JXT2_9PLEO|nr:hypothetical protein BDW02DRAFT_199428 [Decorospora gaudefroyi]